VKGPSRWFYKDEVVKSTGNSSARPLDDSLELYGVVFREDPDPAIAHYAAHCARKVESADPAVVEAGRHGLALIQRLDQRRQAGDMSGAVSAALELGLYMADWESKDHTERHVERGLKNQRAVKKAARTKADNASERAIEWQAEIEGRPRELRELTVKRIADREGLRPGSVRRAVQRYKARSR
jgi:hypothetical protein